MYYNPLKKKKIDVVVSRASSYSLLASLLLSLNKKIKIMTYKEANNISIKDYLNSLGIQPVTEKGSYGMYRSPLREDNTPSFKVDYNANLWCDYGTGEGGTLIDLVMKQNGCNAYGAICRLEQDDTTSFSFHGKDLPERDTKRQAASPIEIRRIQPLQNPALMRYLQERGISPGTAAPYVQEMYYRIGGKPYFALAFRNDSGGYELRNPARPCPTLTGRIMSYSTLPPMCRKPLTYCSRINASTACSTMTKQDFGQHRLSLWNIPTVCVTSRTITGVIRT